MLLDYIDPEAQHFIDCITLMFKTTSPMLYIPPALLRKIGAKVWRDHVDAWDGIFGQGSAQAQLLPCWSLMLKTCIFMFYVLLVSFVADRCIQNIYRQLRQDAGAPKKYPGVLANLLMLDKLSVEDIKASVTELMAGGVDTVRYQMMMSGCRRSPFFFLIFLQSVSLFLSFRPLLRCCGHCMNWPDTPPSRRS